MITEIERKKVGYVEDICFKLTCYYMAETELYDRTLTNDRSKYDNTEAFICNPTDRALSNKYALLIRKRITDIAENRFGISKDVLYKEFKNQIRIKKFSAQGWINQYNFLCENGEMDFIKE